MQSYVGNEFLAFFLRRGQASEAALEQALSALPGQTPYQVWERWLSPRRKIALVNLGRSAVAPDLSRMERLRRDLWPSPLHENRIRADRRQALLTAGYITSSSGSFARSMRYRSGSLRCDDAGGIAAFCLAYLDEAGDERLFLWSTRPGLRAIAWAESEELVVAGTRPRLVHAVARSFAAPSLDHSYMRDSLVGWSLGDRTPYAGTTLVPVDGLLCIRQDGHALQPHPTPPSERALRFLRREVHLYRAALRDAVEPLRKLPGFELRLSGGKDSRLVASILHDRGITPSTVACHGLAEGPESRVAEQVARALSWPIRFDLPELAYRGSVLDTVRHNMSLADGFFATEPRHVPFPAYGISGEQGPGIVYGHIELQKGGWARFKSEKRASSLEYCRQRVAPMRDFVAPELTAAAQRMVDDYADGLRVEHDAEYGYWINYRFRVCRWLTSHYLVNSYELLPVYPLVDEKVARVVHSAPIEQLVTERLLFATTCKLAPQLGPLPLYNGEYRFEKHRPRTIVELPPPSHASPGCEPKPPRLSHHAALQEACAHVRGGALAAELRELTSPAAWLVIENPTGERMRKSGYDQRRLSGYLWTCYQASVLFTEGLPAYLGER